MAKLPKEELHVSELDGFLNAIRCLLGVASRLYGASLIKKDGKSIDEIAQDIISENIGILVFHVNAEVSFEFIQSLLSKYIYSKLESISSNAIEQVGWNLIEYYGLISTAENETGPWNRLVGQTHKVLEYRDRLGRDGAIFFVEYDKFIVMTYLSWSQ